MTSVRRFLHAAAAVAALSLAGPAAAAEPLQIIAAFDLTGGSAVLDLPSYNGALLAAEAINARGGIDGRTVELIPVDTESRPETVAAKVEAALAAHPDAIAGIGYSYSTEALDAGRVFQAKGLPFVSPGATDPSVPTEVGDFMFYAAYGDDAQAAAMAAFTRDQLGLDRAAVWIDSRDLYTRTVGADFGASFTAGGGTVALARSDDDLAGYATFLDAVKAAAPPVGALYVASMPDAAPDLISRMRAAGVAVPLLSGDGWDADTIVALSKAEGLAGIYFTTHRFLGVDTPAMAAFVADYAKRFGSAPPNAFAPLGFDTVNLIADAIDRAGSTDPRAIRDALAGTTAFPGIVGPIGYAPGVRVPKKEVAVIEIANGVETLRWVAPAK